MKGLSDTSKSAEAVQISLLRQSSIARRIELAVTMTSFAIEGALAALRRRYPEANEHELRLLFAEQQYSPLLSQQLRKTQEKREQ